MIENRYDENSAHLMIKVNGRFDFNCHGLFRKAFVAKPQAKTYTVDLSGVSYLDSSALGMLLLLRNYADVRGAKVFLSHCSMVVSQILKMANFNRLFTISE
ncbi:STAS domain-containing protein [Marinomonas pollencensis]|uniref:Anti-anti-sigma factor n=1 Tax=Marinomonas pollencensis TaxID=491954 RepID=A0A3E0DLG3_9GAMM|nr:STAS domain-containing protein [Marinomonas pollencensis]REG82934.1 anti-anti-sigma factor [Marinomonas pollencensis]